MTETSTPLNMMQIFIILLEEILKLRYPWLLIFSWGIIFLNSRIEKIHEFWTWVWKSILFILVRKQIYYLKEHLIAMRNKSILNNCFWRRGRLAQRESVRLVISNPSLIPAEADDTSFSPCFNVHNLCRTLIYRITLQQKKYESAIYWTRKRSSTLLSVAKRNT